MSLLQKKSNPATTAVNNAGNGHSSVPQFCNPTKAEELLKEARQPMHDDSGATTGLRMRPDYGESDAYTMEMNEENFKGASEGCVIAVASSKIAAPGDMYISSIQFDAKKINKVEKFSFTADRAKAMVFHRMTASNVVKQINGPAFAAKAHIILAYNYGDMFKTLEKVLPKPGPTIRREIQWAKEHLKKQDRIIWYLRWYRLALVKNLMETEGLYDEVKPGVQASKQADDAAGTAPALQPHQQAPEAQQQPKKWLSPSEQLKKLYEQYKQELQAKGAEMSMVDLDSFPEMKRSLDHYYSLPVPDIQNRVLGVESWRQVQNVFSIAEQEWKEQATKMIRPHKEDKIFKQFSDGWAWWWLPRASCSEESKAMGHCGNSPRAGEKNVSILSLREPKKYGKETLWYPHLTFILNGPGETGVLGEMKGRNNDKPVAKYHPYIVELLKDNRIKGVVGGGYLPEHNFAMTDLTGAQRKQVSQANPNIGMTIKDYYNEHGMDDNLVGRIRTILELDEDAHYEDGSFVIHEWKDHDAFIEDCGDQTAKQAMEFVDNGKSDYDSPDGDEMADLLDSSRIDAKILYHIGLALQYHYAPELKQWYSRDDSTEFDPKNVEWLKQAIHDIYDMKVEPEVRAQKSEKRREDEEGKGKKTRQPQQQSPYQIPVIQEFWYAYMDGGPNPDSVEELLNDAVETALNEGDAEIEYSGSRIMQVISEEVAVEEASIIEAQGGRGYRRARALTEKPTVSMPYDWDDWSDDRAEEELIHQFAAPPKRPGMENQKRLFKEPKDQEEAKRRGITISKLLKNKLFFRSI